MENIDLYKKRLDCIIEGMALTAHYVGAADGKFDDKEKELATKGQVYRANIAEALELEDTDELDTDQLSNKLTEAIEGLNDVAKNRTEMLKMLEQHYKTVKSFDEYSEGMFDNMTLSELQEIIKLKGFEFDQEQQEEVDEIIKENGPKSDELIEYHRDELISQYEELFSFSEHYDDTIIHYAVFIAMISGGFLGIKKIGKKELKAINEIRMVMGETQEDIKSGFSFTMEIAKLQFKQYKALMKELDKTFNKTKLSDTFQEDIIGEKIETDNTNSIREMLLNSLGKNADELEDDDFLKIKDAIIGGDDDYCFDELKRCLNMTRLSIENLTDFTKLEGLPKLEKLQLIHCECLDLSFLKTFPNLKTLYLDCCNISNHDGLKDYDLNIKELFINPYPYFDVGDIPYDISKLRVSQHEKMFAPSLSNSLNCYSTQYLDISDLMTTDTYGLSQCTSLESLVVNYEFADSEEFKELLAIPFLLCDLRMLRIDNQGNDEGAEKLKDYLENIRPNLDIQFIEKESGISINF